MQQHTPVLALHAKKFHLAAFSFRQQIFQNVTFSSPAHNCTFSLILFSLPGRAMAWPSAGRSPARPRPTPAWSAGRTTIASTPRRPRTGAAECGARTSAARATPHRASRGGARPRRGTRLRRSTRQTRSEIGTFSKKKNSEGRISQ